MKLIAIDMDGTLFSNKKEISQGNIQAMKDAIAQGHVVMICSGRAYEDVISFLKDFDLTLPFAGSNGAVVYTDNHIIDSSAMDLQAAAEMYMYLEEQQYPFKIYTNKGIFSQATFLERTKKAFDSVPEKAEEFRFYLEFLTEHQKKVPSIPLTSFAELQSIEDLEIYKFFIFTPHPEKKQTLLSFIEPIKSLASTSSGIDNIEVMGIDAHKGNGLIQMAKHYSIPMEDTVAIGDNFNDVPMLKVAGLSIAMGNAEDEIKELCDVTTLTNVEDGVAYAIRKYVLKENV